MSTPAGDDVAGTGRLIITLDAGDSEAEAARLGDRIERVLARAAREAGLRMQREIRRAVRAINPVKIRVEADARPFGHTIRTLGNFDAVQVSVEPDMTGFMRAVRAYLRDEEVGIRVVPDFDGFNTAVRQHRVPPLTYEVRADVDRGLSRSLSVLTGALSGVGRAAAIALGIGAVGIAAAGAVSAVSAFAAALAPTVGIIAALPAVITGVVAANVALKLALNGVSDAFSAALTGDAAKFEESLKDLSPAAQAAAREVRALRPALEALRTSVQDSFFNQFEGQITKTAEQLGGPLRKGLSAISGEFGKAASSALDFLASTDGIKSITTILGGTTGALSGLSTATQPVLKGFLDISAAISKAFGPGLGQGIAQAGAQFGTFLSGLAASGRAVELVEKAAGVFKQLGTLAGNIGGIIGGVFEAGETAGAGFLRNLVTVTGQVEEFIKSAQGQTALQNVFSTVGTIAAQLGPILSALVTQIGAIAPALAPLFTTLGPAITTVINALGPALQGVLPGVQALINGLSDGLEQIASSGALTALSEALGQVGTALAPLLPLLGQLIASVGTALAPVISALAAALAPVISALAGALTPILPPLTAAFTTLATALTPVITLIGTTLAEVITAIAPAFATIAGVIAQVATAIAPLIAQVTEALVPAFQMLAPLVAQNVAAFTPLIEQLVSALLPVLPPIIEAFTAIFTALIPIVPVLLQIGTALVPLVSNLIAIVGPAIQFGAEIIKWVALNAVVPVITRIVTVLSTIVGAVTGVITSVSGFQARMIAIFNNVRSAVTSTVLGLVGSVVGFFQNLATRAVSAVSGIVGSLAGVFNSARAAVLSRVASLVSSAVSSLGSLIGRAKGALSGAAGALVSAGADLIRGFISGVKSQAGALVSAAKGVVQGAVNGAKSLLGISSPSKVFAEIGKFVGQGFIKGLTGTENDIKQAAEQVIGKIRDAFKGKNTRLDDQLLKQIAATNKRLVGLANQRDAIVKRIADARKFAADTAASALQGFSLRSLPGGGATLFNITEGLEQAVNDVRDFNRQINSLARRGLRKDLLQQLIGLGPEQGAQLAATLSKASGAQLREINSLQKELTDVTGKLGRDSADILFDSGKKAGEGFLAGIKGQQKSIEKLMLDIAKGMQKAIRKALGIKSPSTVFREIGTQTGRGLQSGLLGRLSMLEDSARRAAVAVAAATADGLSALNGVTASPALRVVGEPSVSGASPVGQSAAPGTSVSQLLGRRTGQSAVGNSTINNEFVINEATDAETVARTVLRRLAQASLA